MPEPLVLSQQELFQWLKDQGLWEEATSVKKKAPAVARVLENGSYEVKGAGAHTYIVPPKRFQQKFVVSQAQPDPSNPDWHHYPPQSYYELKALQMKEGYKPILFDSPASYSPAEVLEWRVGKTLLFQRLSMHNSYEAYVVPDAEFKEKYAWWQAQPAVPVQVSSSAKSTVRCTVKDGRFTCSKAEDAEEGSREDEELKEDVEPNAESPSKKIQLDSLTI